MNKKRVRAALRVICALFAAATLLSALPASVSALYWNGSSEGGGGNGTYATVNGYGLRTLGDNVIAYRFSVLDGAGQNRVSRSIDVFREGEYGDAGLAYRYKFTEKWGKMRLIDNQNRSFSSSLTDENCYAESEMDFATPLPVPSEMETWQNYETNLNRILYRLGIGSIDNLETGDKITVEPVYDIKIEKIWHAVTVSEAALYGKYLLGASSDGGSSATAETWGFISEYTNRHYPNSLFTPDGMGLWEDASALARRATFRTIINSGYGVGIAYNVASAVPDPGPGDDPGPGGDPGGDGPGGGTGGDPGTGEDPPADDFTPVLAVTLCQAWPGTCPSRKNAAYGMSSGPRAENWTCGAAYPEGGDTVWYSVYFPKEKRSCRVRQTVWSPDGGTVSREIDPVSASPWFDAGIEPSSVPADSAYITVKGRSDWIDADGNVLRYGAEKTFLIPVRPGASGIGATAYAADGSVLCETNRKGAKGSLYAGARVAFFQNYAGTASSPAEFGLLGMTERRIYGEYAPITEENEGYDVVRERELLSAAPKAVRSSVVSYTVPRDPGMDLDDSGVRITESAVWNGDPDAEASETDYFMPVCTPDLEAVEVKLAKDGYYVSPEGLSPGETYDVYLVIKNNTPARVLARVYDAYGAGQGVYSVGMLGLTATAYAGRITVPSSGPFTVTCSVYLESVPRGDTSFESDGTNNTASLLCTVREDVTLRAVEPNAQYREGTDVIASYYVGNRGTVDIVPSDTRKLRLRVYGKNGTLIADMAKDFCVPAGKESLVWFRFTVPEDTGGSVTLKAELEGAVPGEITSVRRTVTYALSDTPDTYYERTAPSWFVRTDPPSGNGGLPSSLSWTEYVYENGRIIEKYRTVSVSFGTLGVRAHTETGAGLPDGHVRSGYALSLDAKTELSGDPGDGSVTGVQYARALFPEYMYLTETGKYATLELSTDRLVFPGTHSGRTNAHFTPVWMPDGEYTVRVEATDCWTPAGCIGVCANAGGVTLDGSVYDDRYVTRG